MAADLIYHFPPDVFDALADAIPLLVRARKDVLLFFRGWGVDQNLLEDLTIRMDWDRDFGKYAPTNPLVSVTFPSPPTCSPLGGSGRWRPLRSGRGRPDDSLTVSRGRSTPASRLVDEGPIGRNPND